MKLTGIAKEQFEKWFNTHKVYKHLCLATFKELPEAMQFGVIQDWADSEDLESCAGFPTRQEARNAAIEKLNEIINKG